MKNNNVLLLGFLGLGGLFAFMYFRQSKALKKVNPGTATAPRNTQQPRDPGGSFDPGDYTSPLPEPDDNDGSGAGWMGQWLGIAKQLGDTFGGRSSVGNNPPRSLLDSAPGDF